MSANVIKLNSKKLNYEVSGSDAILDLYKQLEKNFLNGEKNIAVCSTHYNSLQQKFILLGLNYFNQNYPSLKIAVISFALEEGQFEEFILNSSQVQDSSIYNFSDHFDLISWKYVLENKLEQSMTESYDLLLWELPEIEKISKNAILLKDSLEKIKSLYIISHRLNNSSEIEFRKSTSQYFLNHGVKISHIVPLELEQAEGNVKKMVRKIKSVFKKVS